MMKYRGGKNLKEIASIFDKAGFSVYLVGGAVRDWLLGKACTDLDIATDALPEQVQRLFKKTIPTGIEHGTVTVLYKGEKIECTTFRCEADYGDGRRPDAVRYVRTIEEDLSRRDFTMNAVAVSLKDGSVTDPFGGAAAVKAKEIRAVGDPVLRFTEDGLRPIRCIRFAAQLGFSIEESTFKAIPETLHICKKISIERFRDEFIKILQTENPVNAFILMEKTGILELFLPELSGCRSVEQKGRHRFDVLDHCLLACGAAPKDDLTVRLAALFHDIGKPAVRSVNEYGEYTFYKHEQASAQLAEQIMKRLKFPNKETEAVCRLVGLHMFHYTEDWSDAAVRRFIAHAGAENLPRLFALRRADGFAITGRETDPRRLLSLQKRIDVVLQEKNALTLKDLAVNGNDLIAMGIPAGQKIGILLKKLMEAVLEDPAQNTKERLLSIAGALNCSLHG